MGGFFYDIINGLITLMIIVIFVDVAASWLVQFNVVNIRNPAVRQIVGVFDALCRPILWPLRRVIPPFGGLDITPVIAILVLGAAQSRLLPWLFRMLPPALG